MGRKRDEKPIPPMGPGSKVVALTPQLLRHITQRMVGKKKNIKAFDMSFNTILMKKLPEEIFKNEELIQHAHRFEAPNNRIKKLPKDVNAWTELEHFDIHHNQLKRFVFIRNSNQTRSFETKTETLFDSLETLNKHCIFIQQTN